MKYSFKELFDPIINKLDFFLNGRYWVVKTTLISLIGIAVFCPPNPYFYSSEYEGGLFGAKVISRADHIFTPPDYGDDILHESKTYFRIFIPVVCKLFHITKFQTLYLLQSIIGIFSLGFCYLLSYKITGDKVSAFLCGLSITFLYVGRAAFHDISGWFDAFAYFFLVISMFHMPIVFKIFFLECAYFTDERSLLSALVICLFHILDFKKERFAIDIFKREAMAVGFSIIIYIGARFFLTYYFGLKNIIPNENLHLKHLTHTFWSGLEGMWLLMFVSLIILFRTRKYLIIASIFLLISIFLTMTLNIGDQTRSIAYIFPLLFVFLYVSNSYLENSDLRIILFLALFVTMLYPADFYINGFERNYNQPIYIKILKVVFPKSIY